MAGIGDDDTHAGVMPVSGDLDTLHGTRAPGSSKPASVRATDDDTTLGDDAQRYDRKALLGRGGMGEVFLCADLRIGRSVAMKQIREGVASDPAARRRFFREARVQGQLEHPAIVPVYELARTEAGQAYFTMKRVKGESLHEILERQRQGESDPTEGRRRLLNAFAQVCLAIDFAHERGVLHRDIKPANIMLGKYGEVYVLDWGLAKIEDAPELDDLTFEAEHEAGDTRAGALMGTLGYMPPEQLSGDVTKTSDVYALGAVLFELLSLHRLHAADVAPAMVTATLDGADAKVRSRYPTLSIPPELEAICVRATATDPAERFPTARQLHDALTSFLDGDRDLELRRAAARDEAARAAKLGQAALGGDDEARVPAMQAVGAALGLDPTNREALGTLAQLLDAPPKELPPEAAAELDALHEDQLRLAARDGAMGFVSWVVYVPLLLLMGLRDVFSLAVSTALMAAAATFSFWVARRDHSVRSYSVPIMVLGTLALSSMTRMFGPYLLLPMILMGQAVAFGLSPFKRERHLAAAMSGLGILGPTLLESLGWIPSQTEFRDGAIVVLPGMMELSPTLTPVVLAVAHMAIIVTPVIVIGRAREAWNAVQRENAVRAWHFRRLVGAADASSAASDTDAKPDASS